MRYERAILSSLFAMFFIYAGAQDNDSLKHWGGAVSVNPGYLLKTKQYEGKYDIGNKHNFAVAAELSYSTLPSDSDAYAADYNYPVISVGVKYAVNNNITFHRLPEYDWGGVNDIDYDSRVGNSVSLYGKFARTIFRNRHLQFDGAVQMGVGYSHTIYDKYKNVDNDLIGSHLTVYFGAGFYLTYMVAKDWGVKAGVEYWHLSNGALDRPNKGSNFIGPSVGLCYVPYYKEITQTKYDQRGEKFDKYWYLNFTAGLGAKTLEEDWNETQSELPHDHPDFRTEKFHLYMAYSAQADIMYRYARRWASGIGFDLFYGSYASRIEERDQQKNFTDKHSPWSFGISAKHEIYYHNVSMNVSLGYYFFREMGNRAKIVEKRYYESIGGQYHCKKLGGMAIGFRVKAHLVKADYTELVLSYPIRLKKL